MRAHMQSKRPAGRPRRRAWGSDGRVVAARL